jgi:hypothetical protein
MAKKITCTSCGSILEVPEACIDRWLTCPRCLAKVATFETSSQIPDRPMVSSPYDDVHREVQRDTRGVGVGVILLAVLGGLGLVQMLFCAGALANDSPEFLVGLLIGLGFLASVSTGIMFLRTQHNPEARGVGRVIVGTLALVGVLTLLVIALIVFLLAMCLAGGGPRFN